MNSGTFPKYQIKTSLIEKSQLDTWHMIYKLKLLARIWQHSSWPGFKTPVTSGWEAKTPVPDNDCSLTVLCWTYGKDSPTFNTYLKSKFYEISVCIGRTDDNRQTQVEQARSGASLGKENPLEFAGMRSQLCHEPLPLSVRPAGLVSPFCGTHFRKRKSSFPAFYKGVALVSVYDLFCTCDFRGAFLWVGCEIACLLLECMGEIVWLE